MHQEEDPCKVLRRRGVLVVLAGSAGVVVWIVYPAIQAETFPDWIELNSRDVPVAHYLAWTLWDWLRMVLLPLVLAVGGLLFIWFTNRRMQAMERTRVEKHQQIERDRAQDAILKAYLDQMTDLVLNHALHAAAPDAAVRRVARAYTLIALQRVNGARRATIVRFLYEVRLIGYTDGTDTIAAIVPLDGALLAGAILGSDGSWLGEAKFLLWATLEGADVRMSTYGGGDWTGVDWGRANLAGACLQDARLVAAHLWGAWFSHANLQHADLRGAHLQWANLANANLQRANLTDANLRSSHLADTNLAGAHLDRVDLTGCWSVRRTQLRQAASLHGAKLPNHIHPTDLGDLWSPPQETNLPAPES